MSKEAMKLALEALETGGWNKTTAAITALRERLARPNEFEPDWDQVEALQESLREHMAEIHRLRQWQGLTGEEINSVRHNRDWTAPWTDAIFARAIEAKLRERNT